VFEPNANPAAKIYQEALFKQGIPFTAFEVEEIDSETQRLKKKRVKFTMDPTDAGPGKDCYFFRHVREFDSDIPLAGRSRAMIEENMAKKPERCRESRSTRSARSLRFFVYSAFWGGDGYRFCPSIPKCLVVFSVTL
jgi:hypothetical protein